METVSVDRITAEKRQAAFWERGGVSENKTQIKVDASSSASVLVPGNTARMATWIQERTGGDLFSIVVSETYSSVYDECLDRAADEKAENARPKRVIRSGNVIFLDNSTANIELAMRPVIFKLEATDDVSEMDMYLSDDVRFSYDCLLGNDIRENAISDIYRHESVFPFAMFCERQEP